VAVSRRPRRQRFVLLVATLLSVTIITLDQRGQGSGIIGGARDVARDVISPFQGAADWVLDPVGDFFGGVLNYGDLKSENATLRRELEEAKSSAAQADNLSRELDAIKEQLDLPFVQEIPAVTARIVNYGPSNFEFTVQLDKGTTSGIGEGMPVVAAGGLVGIVVEASRSRSSVRLLSDPGYRVGVRFGSAGDIGVAQGKGRGALLAVDLVEPTTVIPKNETVVTSGLAQSEYPPGIPVGRVQSATTPKGALTKRVTVEPLVDLNRLDLVQVLQWSPQG
jgi:rod shape-determining protein MreC